ncbi:hypothetical protein SNOUR_37665 [Streptomyces noursei ATCC 11455]|nr:hypothetical protein SNOUR_37665 [Streptomyces noursei ATCC 11455]
MTGERLGRGSLSSALTRLRGKGLIEYLDGEGRRRPMRLTFAGREMLKGEIEVLAQVAGRIFEAVVPDKIATRIGSPPPISRTPTSRPYSTRWPSNQATLSWTWAAGRAPTSVRWHVQQHPQGWF